MEAEIRGLLESLIDDFTSEKGLKLSFGIVRGFDPLVKSEEDAVFGYTLGMAFSNFMVNCQTKFDRKPLDSEYDSFCHMYEERAQLIMSKIRKYANL